MVNTKMKTFFVPSLNHLNTLLRQNTYNYSPCVYGSRIVMKHEIKEEGKFHTLRMYRTQSFLDIWYEYPSRQFVGALDYKIQPESIKIEYININDDENICPYENKLNKEESEELMEAMVEHVKNQATDDKVLLDVHQNLRLYKKNFEKLGFTLTERKSCDNPFWIEAELGLGETKFSPKTPSF